MKSCNTCKDYKELTNFSKDKTSKDGYNSKCRVCCKIYHNSNKKYISERTKLYYENNKEAQSNRMKDWRVKNPEKQKEIINNYTLKNKEKIKDYHNQYDKDFNNKKRKSKLYVKKYNSDLTFKIKEVLRKRLLNALKSKSKNNTTLELLGCSIEEFKLHLEQQFKPEMSWENYGKIWEIDHKKQCILFDLTYIEQQKQCFHYTNLRPLFKTTEIAQSLGYLYEIGNRNRNKYN